MIDFKFIKPILRKFPNINIKMYLSSSIADSFDQFISVIEKTGRTSDLAASSLRHQKLQSIVS